MEQSKTREESNFRRTLVFDLQDEETIKDYLHPKKRTRFEILKRLYQPILSDKKLVWGHIMYSLSAGLLALLSAFILQFIIPIMTDLLARGEVDMEGESELLVPIALYSVLYLVLSVISIHIEERIKVQFTKIRMGLVAGVAGKTAQMEIGLKDNARFLNQLGDYFEPIQQTNSGVEGVYIKVFETGKSVVAVLLLSVILARVHVVIPGMALVAIILVTYADYRYSKAHKVQMPAFTAIRRKFSNLINRAQDFSYGKDIRVFKLQDQMKKRSEDVLEDQLDLQANLRKSKRPSSLIKGFALSLLQIAILYFLFRGYFNQHIDLTFLIMILSVLTIFTNEMFQVTQMIAFVYEQSINMDYFYDFMDADLYVEGGEEWPSDFQGPMDIVFDDVWFRYPGTENWVLEGINLTINEEESLALVGVNGAGKTTLTNLLCGLYAPEKGTITIGGRDLQSFSREALQKHIAVVLQSYEPIAVSVKENVAPSGFNIDEERVADVLTQVGLYDKIVSFDKGIDSTMLRVIEDDGLVLSGGENQKLSIARALYQEASKIMILDEPTSALDALAEQTIYQDFANMMEGKTGIFISHRLASTRFCDKIALLDGGRIAQIGRHEDLVKEDGLYRDLYETQASYYRKEETDEEQAEFV